MSQLPVPLRHQTESKSISRLDRGKDDEVCLSIKASILHYREKYWEARDSLEPCPGVRLSWC